MSTQVLEKINKAKGELKKYNIDFEEKNEGVHLIVISPLKGNKVVDFYPTNGKFIYRTGGSGRGLENLLRKFRVIK